MSPTKLLTYKSYCFLTSAFISLLKVSNFDLSLLLPVSVYRKTLICYVKACKIPVTTNNYSNLLVIHQPQVISPKNNNVGELSSKVSVNCLQFCR